MDSFRLQIGQASLEVVLLTILTGFAIIGLLQVLEKMMVHNQALREIILFLP